MRIKNEAHNLKTVLVSGVMLGGLLLGGAASATDLVRLTSSAGSDGAGSIVGIAPTPQTAVLANPALLSRLDDSRVFTLTGLSVNSEFTNKLGEVSSADSGPGALPEFGIKGSVSDSDWSWGAALTIQSALLADFRFTDPPGTAGVSYGVQRHRSGWVIAKAGAALSYQFNDRLSAGLTLGIAYNRNELEAPYIFQSHPVLTGLKVLVDLSADDVALTSGLGISYAVSESVDVNLAYSLRTDFSADGDLSGNLGQLGLGIQEDFTYAANVETALPAVLLAGLSWRASERFTLGLQWDRVYWQDSFETLPIKLTQGSNPDLNAFLGESSIFDTAPLQWRDQDTFHIGGEYSLSGGMKLRLGYESTEPPVPGRTFTPLTGAIFDRAYSAGMQFAFGSNLVDVAYRYSTGSDLRVADSALAGNEYDGTQQSLSLHSLVFSLAF